MIRLAWLLLLKFIEIFKILCFLLYIAVFLLSLFSANIIELMRPVAAISRTFSATAAAALDVDLMLEQELICENGHFAIE